MISSSLSPVQRAQKQLHRLFPEDPALHGAIAWATETLHAASLDPSSAPLRSLRALRRADPRLSTVAARFLVEAAAGHAPATGGRRPGSPLVD